VTGFDGLGLRPLPPETWGQRFTRARRIAGYGLRDVEAKLLPLISRATLDRIEKLDDVPTRRQHRARAVVALVLYGFDPTEFELGTDDVPPAVDLRAVVKLRD
jgi:hypothetical protein